MVRRFRRTCCWTVTRASRPCWSRTHGRDARVTVALAQTAAAAAHAAGISDRFRKFPVCNDFAAGQLAYPAAAAHDAWNTRDFLPGGKRGADRVPFFVPVGATFPHGSAALPQARVAASRTRGRARPPPLTRFTPRRKMDSAGWEGTSKVFPSPSWNRRFCWRHSGGLPADPTFRHFHRFDLSPTFNR